MTLLTNYLLILNFTIASQCIDIKLHYLRAVNLQRRIKTQHKALDGNTEAESKRSTTMPQKTRSTSDRIERTS
jgi:hypothetical protein